MNRKYTEKDQCVAEGCFDIPKCKGMCRLHHARWTYHGDVNFKRPTIVERFWAHAQRLGDCLVWSGTVNEDGYGKYTLSRGKMVSAHRYAWSVVNGPIPDGLNVLHTCDNPPCIDIDHLFLGTQQDNINDMVKKGRNKSVSGEQHKMAKLTTEQVQYVRKKYATGEVFLQQLAVELGVTRTTISRVVHYENWKTL